MRVITAPVMEFGNQDSEVTVFLAGSIEIGTAEDWQSRLTERLSNYDNLVLYNPRRPDWDSSWVHSIHNEQFVEQVRWELSHIDDADIVAFVFDPKTKSPITLMELGYAIGQGKLIMVCCPEGFWRKGNVDVIIDYSYIFNNEIMYENFDDFVIALQGLIDTNLKLRSDQWIEP